MKRIVITLMSLMLIVLAYGQANLKAGGEVRLSPRLLNYQGFLTDTLGNPITNPSVSVTFGIWTSSGGGTQVWFETQSVSIAKGIFSAVLGNTTPIPDSVFTRGTDRWLELTYAGITLSPRTRITAAGYAVSATYSDTAYSVVNNAITTPKILDTAVTMAKIARAGAATNQVIKWNGSMWQPSTDVASSDTDWIFSGNNIYSGVSGNVGIGTTTPNAMLSFGTSVVDNKMYLYDGAGTKYGLGIRSAELMVYCGPGGHTAFGHYDGTTFTERMRMDNLGRVGIGTASPIERLDVNGGINFRRGDGDTIWRWALFHNASSGVGDFGLSFWKNTPAMYLVLGNSSNNSYFPTGNVGIGTATPAVKFDVAGYVRSTGSDDVGGGLSVFNSSKTGAIVNNWMIYNMTGVYGNALKFWRYYQNGANPGPAFTLYDNGNAEVAGVTLTNGLVTTGITMATGAASGYVLTSNASGVASWLAPALVSHDHLGETWSGYYVCGLRINLSVGTSTSDVYGICDSINQSGTRAAFGCRFLALGSGDGAKYGVWGTALHDGVTGGNAYGGRFYAGGSSNRTKYGIYSLTNDVGTCWAGYFSGDVNVTGSLTKGSGSFLIDHPLDPTNKTLRHNFVESPENLCLYRGKVKLNSSGEGKVTMPDYFKALTKETEATVTLTSIGRPFNTGYEWNPDYTVCTVYGEPNREVSYIVMADRDDPVMKQLYKPVEEEKGNGNFTKGKLLYPKAYGYSEEMGEDYERQKEAESHADAGKIQ